MLYLVVFAQQKFVTCLKSSWTNFSKMLSHCSRWNVNITMLCQFTKKIFKHFPPCLGINRFNSLSVYVLRYLPVFSLLKRDLISLWRFSVIRTVQREYPIIFAMSVDVLPWDLTNTVWTRCPSVKSRFVTILAKKTYDPSKFVSFLWNLIQ